MTANRYWLQLPLVQAPSPTDRNETITYHVSETYIRTLLTGKRLTQIYWAWTHVAGELPPINNVSRLNRGPVVPSLTTLAQSVACFRGVKRPYVDDEDGDSVIVYVLNPTVSIAHDVNMVCLARAVQLASNTCLTVQVRPSAALQPQAVALNSIVTRSIDSGDDKAVHGVITRLEFIPGNGEKPVLPRQHRERYLERLW